MLAKVEERVILAASFMANGQSCWSISSLLFIFGVLVLSHCSKPVAHTCFAFVSLAHLSIHRWRQTAAVLLAQMKNIFFLCDHSEISSDSIDFQYNTWLNALWHPTCKSFRIRVVQGSARSARD